MPDNRRRDSTRRAKAALIDTTVPNAARVGDYLHGGRNNFEADRRAVRAVVAAAPAIGTILPATRAFHQRVVRYLVAKAGIRQFLDIGTTLQTTGNTHELAQSLVPECRVVYVDNDPMVLGHVRALLTSVSDGAIASLDANLMDPRTIVSGAAETLDFSRLVAVLLRATLTYVLSDAAATAIMLSLVEAVTAGSPQTVVRLAPVAQFDCAFGFDCAVGRSAGLGAGLVSGSSGWRACRRAVPGAAGVDGVRSAAG